MHWVPPAGFGATVMRGGRVCSFQLPFQRCSVVHLGVAGFPVGTCIECHLLASLRRASFVWMYGH